MFEAKKLAVHLAGADGCGAWPKGVPGIQPAEAETPLSAYGDEKVVLHAEPLAPWVLQLAVAVCQIHFDQVNVQQTAVYFRKRAFCHAVQGFQQLFLHQKKGIPFLHPRMVDRAH